MRVIYTSVHGLHIPNVDVRDISVLTIAPLILSRQKMLLRRATLPENVSANMMAVFDEPPIRQAYFRIRKRSYYLDFFFPKRMIAVEIDGSSHDKTREHDRQRDADFRSIGIRTIRIKNKDVMSGKLYKKLFKRLYK